MVINVLLSVMNWLDTAFPLCLGTAGKDSESTYLIVGTARTPKPVTSTLMTSFLGVD